MRVKIKSTEECLKIDRDLHCIDKDIFRENFAGKIFISEGVSAGAHIILTLGLRWYVPEIFCEEA